MQHTISNKSVTIRVAQRGAELCSIEGADGTEYLWQADPKIWGRHAPVLFPIVGKLANNRYVFQDQTFEMNQHGFARDMDFQMWRSTSSSLSYRLLATPQTLALYPFEFTLDIEYQLEGTSLKVIYSVANNGNGDMPFSIGAHPALALNWTVGDVIEDYFVEFEKTETADAHLLNSNDLLSNQTVRVLDKSNTLHLHKGLFDDGALIFLNLSSKSASLRSSRHNRSVTMEFSGFPHLGIWAKPGAPFVCIEPWHGHVDPAQTDGRIVNKPGIIHLKPQEIFARTYNICINP